VSAKVTEVSERLQMRVVKWFGTNTDLDVMILREFAMIAVASAARRFGWIVRPNRHGREYREKGEQVRVQPPESLDRVRMITLAGS
jgi:hypothetical protein